MSRYIDADKLIERLKFKRDIDTIDRKKYAGLECAIAQCKKAPTADVVEVVRCKDCKSCLTYQKWNGKKYAGCCRNGEIYEVEPNHYCSYGERRDE